MVYITDILNDIVEQVAEDYGAPVYYLHGHPVEIVNILKERSKHAINKFRKFPLIALLQDFEEVKGGNQSVNSQVSLNLIIATRTESKYLSSERYKLNFKPILHPIYEYLLDRIALHPAFGGMAPGVIPHTKIDRLYWGKQGLYGNEANIFNDRIDAVEIVNLELEILNHFKNC